MHLPDYNPRNFRSFSTGALESSVNWEKSASATWYRRSRYKRKSDLHLLENLPPRNSSLPQSDSESTILMINSEDQDSDQTSGEELLISNHSHSEIMVKTKTELSLNDIDECDIPCSTEEIMLSSELVHKKPIIRLRSNRGLGRSVSTNRRPTSFILPTASEQPSNPQITRNNTMKIQRRKSKRYSTISRAPTKLKDDLAGTSVSSTVDTECINSENPSNIRQTMENIRRLSRKLSYRRTIRRKKTDEEQRIAIGTRIDKDHKNYILMYNMLTGIRVAVSRCTGKSRRDLHDIDFSAAHKLAFDIVGNEMTPSSKYDFKFKDYAPWVFRHLRELFGIDSAEYLVSLTSKYILSELGSPGKSGSFFYYSQDYRFIIKTIHHTEHKFLRRILPYYYQHVKENPNTLISRFFGLHRVKLPHSRKIHFVVMANNFPPNKDIHETYDLKGSTVGRELGDEDLKKSPHAVMKDLNWQTRDRKLEIGPEKRQLFVDQMDRDVKLLKELKIMDYSLLVGLHDKQRGNRDNIRDNTLSVFKPDTEKLDKPIQKRGSYHPDAVRKMIVESDPIALGPSNSTLPEDPFNERNNCIFYQDEGGFAGSDESGVFTDTIFYVGIIDILTPYNFAKRMEHMWKSLSHDKNGISAVNPSLYANRFMDFMTKAIKIHDDIQRRETLRRRRQSVRRGGNSSRSKKFD
ncbi:Phosphatidylinositol-4-phosphate 5-kinase [Basidiobolus ranarum]|uniref:Phosphatidylinositol-4-phosphate 5-kinase n=1 Tax=Basidiobolus ranarum TaxID=34480 RepID=A0ABR2WY33_9FUNG